MSHFSLHHLLITLQRLLRSRQFMAYIVVGLTANGLNLGLYALLEGMIGLSYQWASAISTPVSLLVNYSLHRFLTFRANTTTTRSTAPRYVALVSINFIIEQALLFALVDLVGLGAWIAKALVVMFIIGYNFLALRFLVFVHRPTDAPLGKGA